MKAFKIEISSSSMNAKGLLQYYEIDTKKRVAELYTKYSEAVTDIIVKSIMSEALPWYLSKYESLANFMDLKL